MIVNKVSGELAAPTGGGWSGVDAESVSLDPVSLESQPTEYIRAAWADREYGKVGEVKVSTAHDGKRAYVRLEWEDSDAPDTEFADAAAVFFPAQDQGAPAETIGSEDQAVNLWLWQADREARDLLSTGPGRFRLRGTDEVAASAERDSGRWSVVLSRGLDDVRNGGKLGVAVWDGSNEERAGIGSVSTEWISLEIEG